MRALTDEQIIERLRRAQRWRRPVGIALLLLGILSTSLLLYIANQMHEQSLALFAELRQVTTPTTQQVRQTFDAVQFNIGFGLGSALVAGLASCCSLAVSGFVLLWPNRKDRLLLECWSRQHVASGATSASRSH